MRALFTLLFFVALAGLFVTGIFYFVAGFLGSIAFNPESSSWKKLLAKLRERLKKRMASPLAPCNSENLSQLSLHPKILKKASWRDSVFEGVFNTIYKEPVMMYAGQKIGNTAAIVAQTSDKEFIFRLKGKEIEIWQNGQPYAVFVKNTLLAAGSQGKLLAKLEPDSELRQWPVLIGHSEGATLANAKRAVSPIPRAVTLLRNLQPEEEQALLVLSVLQGLK